MSQDPKDIDELPGLESRIRARVVRFLAQVLPESGKVERRGRVRATPFPEEWRSILTSNVPHYRNLDVADRGELEQQVLVFLDEKQFEGCGGLELTDEMRVTIAGHACLLSLARDLDFYPQVKVILVYPDAYVARHAAFTSPDPHHEDRRPRLGESWAHGVVVISWRGVRETSGRDARNLVMHEFAHQLDHEDGRIDGIPLIDGSGSYRTWARLIADEFDRHVATIERGEDTVLDPYGMENRGEFFAVAVETFFERPRELQAERPELYALLSEYFGQNPAGSGPRDGSTDQEPPRG